MGGREFPGGLVVRIRGLHCHGSGSTPGGELRYHQHHGTATKKKKKERKSRVVLISINMVEISPFKFSLIFILELKELLKVAYWAISWSLIIVESHHKNLRVESSLL